jgi:hypothetical protein
MLVFPQGIQGGLRRILTLFTGPGPKTPTRKALHEKTSAPHK